MEVAESDLKSYMETNFQEIGLEGKISICLDIAKAIAGLLSLEYYHRDLKPDNILVKKDGSLVDYDFEKNKAKINVNR